MNFPQLSADGEDPSPPRKGLQLQGPRPAPLKVRNESHKIKKPPLPPPSQQARSTAAADTSLQRREPVIIYAVSPKIIHADASEFMNVVQRLTGPSLFSDELSRAGDISPAARLASIEKASPSEGERERERERAASDDVMSIAEEEGVEMSQIQGILSPAPSSLTQMWAGFFSPPVTDQPHGLISSLFLNNELNSPFFLQGTTSFMLPSPSTLFSNSIISPTLPYDLFNHNDF